MTKILEMNSLISQLQQGFPRRQHLASLPVIKLELGKCLSGPGSLFLHQNTGHDPLLEPSRPDSSNEVSHHMFQGGLINRQLSPSFQQFISLFLTVHLRNLSYQLLQHQSVLIKFFHSVDLTTAQARLLLSEDILDVDIHLKFLSPCWGI